MPVTAQELAEVVASGKKLSDDVTALNARITTLVKENHTDNGNNGGNGALYQEIGGIPAGAKQVAAGDLSSLVGDVLLTSAGGYSASGKISANIYAKTPGALVKANGTQQVQLAKGIKLAGVCFEGFGLEKSTDGTKAGVVTDDSCQLHSVEVRKSVGVGILFKGSKLISYDLHSHNNGTSGRMIRSRGDNVHEGSGFHEVRSHLHHNNIGGKKSDAANKATQTSDHFCEDIKVHDEADGGLWYDIACWNITIARPEIRDITTSAEWYRGVGLRFELNAYGTYPSTVTGGYIGEVSGAAIAINESSNIRIWGMKFGKCKLTLEVRQQTRDDDPGDGGSDASKWLKDANKRLGPGRGGDAKLGWEVFEVHFTDNTLNAGAGPLGLSDSKGTIKPFTTDLRLGKNNIVIKDNTGNIDVQIPA